MNIVDLSSWKEEQLTLSDIEARTGIRQHVLKYAYKKSGIAYHRASRHSWDFGKLIDESNPDGQYAIGLMAADGYIDNGRSIGIYLQVADEELIQRLLMVLNQVGRKINHRTTLLGSRQCGITIGSVDLIRFLETHYGFLPRKSRTLPFPRHLKNPLPYLRGFLDGDGYIGYGCTFTVGSKDFAEGLLDWVYEEYGFEPNVQMVGKNKDIYNITFRKKHAEFIHDLFSYPGLTRKTEAYLRYLPN